MGKKRGAVAALVDRLLARQLGLSPETCSWTVSDVRVLVQHGTAQFELAGDPYQLLRTGNTKPKGTILVRSPSGRNLAFALTNAHFYIACGYNCLLVSSRGTFGLEGVFEPPPDRVAAVIQCALVSMSPSSVGLPTMDASVLHQSDMEIKASRRGSDSK
jgi:hypothetical protein